MKKVALVYQPYVPATLIAAQSVADYLERRSSPYQLISAHALSNCSADDIRLAICFGGDGTALRTARWLSGVQVPVVPVKMGKLSFLGEVSPSDLPHGLEAYLSGDFWRDERAMLDVVCHGQRSVALNDVVLARGESPRAVRIEVAVDDAPLTTYLADGVIVSTPTGSTAYSLAAGGPVLAPELRVMAITPIAAHLNPLRSLVVPSTACVRLINRGFVPTILTTDGQQDVVVEPNGEVEVSLSERTSVFARRSDRMSFYRGLAARLTRG